MFQYVTSVPKDYFDVYKSQARKLKVFFQEFQGKGLTKEQQKKKGI
jgi:hypothetical protein